MSLRSLIQPHSVYVNGNGYVHHTWGGDDEHNEQRPTVSPLAERVKAAAAWDPSYEKEEMDWYSEYAARHGPFCFNWLQQPGRRAGRRNGNKKTSREVKGMGMVRDWSAAKQDRVVAPLDDGSVCVWDLDHSLSAKGRVMGTSAPGILTADPVEFLNLRECVSVDSGRGRAYIAVGDVLNEVDLETLRVVSQERYPEGIFALSQETNYIMPLTLATSSKLYIHDYRAPASQEGSTLFQPNPLSVLHPPAPHDNTILVAGRFPSILHYDRRFFPRLQNAVHSGGNLCGLTSTPSPRFASSSGSTGPDSQKVVACGEYKGRGSLELYNLSSAHEPSHGVSTSSLSPAVYQNRQSAAPSKLLSVASHGARLVYTDADGTVKWVERDGRTEVRRWNINTHISLVKLLTHDRRKEEGLGPNDEDDSDSDTDGLWAGSFGLYSSNEVVQKALPTGGTLTSDELLVWTGERIGRIRFSNTTEPDYDKEDKAVEEDMSIDKGLDGTAREKARQRRRTQLRWEREYARQMRKALKGQADEVRRMGDFGTA